MKILILIAAFSHAAFAACLPVNGSRILARDLASADPRYSALPSTLAVGFTPAPGAKRIFTALELGMLARANGISVEHPSDICFELPVQPLREDDAAAAMRRSLPPDASLEILELSKLALPAGQLEFPREAIEQAGPPISNIQLWRGYVRYADTRRAACWARVKVTLRVNQVIAARDLPADTPLNPAWLRIETRAGPLAREQTAARLEDVIGRTLKRPLQAGAPIPTALLADAPAVRRGDPVRVDVQCGPAHLQFDAIAGASGNTGEMIALRNPLSGKTFRARLDAGAKAAVIVPTGEQL